MKPVELKEELIAARAYQLWEKEGSPHGRDSEHWSQAERELAGETQPAEATATTTAVAKNDIPARSRGVDSPQAPAASNLKASPAKPPAAPGKASRTRNS